ncbi:L-cysteine:1D-myo-inositol 2-amino-2-deoxy-alpha-D-glucopyranoside ligase [Segniliparus rugosus ATCC BAA-974]|uniref:L-cysteine:1D-myo-inositol 2-amino-2-deoxy-alpha-D-glucopyranoside ligase n=2 Tax=Segniliparus rugosus TaxID=286804 RepID=U1N4R8_SEGRC|nr:L-cysteine:1D-myo-inositol 2-amino-2-deoxy-alpha-D-glucopyranoside ligase [Segniliparus rugosus ATCC BAA-974]
MYVCGITPYDATHLGHAATYLAFDLVCRLWLDAGHEVHYTQNITDVDDPLLERAERDDRDWRALAAEQIELFRTDMAALRVLPPQDYVGVTESIDLVVAMVEKLLANQSAYVVAEGEYPDVYHRVGATEDFGYVSGYDRDEMTRVFRERGGDPDRPGKADPLDALLWRAARPGEPSWPSPFGPGRPGWHVECSAIALDRIGFGFDVQGGGADLVFPHHEFSAAHAQAQVGGCSVPGADGRGRFARNYVHAGMIGLDGEKMSKSLGNLVFVSKLRAAGVDPSAIRLALFAGHYRADRSWDQNLLAQAQARLSRWRQAALLASGPSAQGAVARLREHLANDLDTPRGIAAVDSWVAEALAYGGSDPTAPALVATAVDALLGVSLGS